MDYYSLQIAYSIIVQVYNYNYNMNFGRKARLNFKHELYKNEISS